MPSQITNQKVDVREKASISLTNLPKLAFLPNKKLWGKQRQRNIKKEIDRWKR